MGIVLEDSSYYKGAMPAGAATQRWLLEGTAWHESSMCKSSHRFTQVCNGATATLYRPAQLPQQNMLAHAGSPAHKAGVHVGDIVTAINGRTAAAIDSE